MYKVSSHSRYASPGGGDFDAELVQGAAAMAGFSQQCQLERRFGDGEVGIAGLSLGRLDAEQGSAEAVDLVDLVDGQRELRPRHGNQLMLKGLICRRLGRKVGARNLALPGSGVAEEMISANRAARDEVVRPEVAAWSGAASAVE
jgi:hypothetical protein